MSLGGCKLTEGVKLHLFGTMHNAYTLSKGIGTGLADNRAAKKSFLFIIIEPKIHNLILLFVIKQNRILFHNDACYYFS